MMSGEVLSWSDVIYSTNIIAETFTENTNTYQAYEVRWNCDNKIHQKRQTSEWSKLCDKVCKREDDSISQENG